MFQISYIYSFKDEMFANYESRFENPKTTNEIISEDFDLIEDFQDD